MKVAEIFTLGWDGRHNDRDDHHQGEHRHGRHEKWDWDDHHHYRRWDWDDRNHCWR